jgi:hypothetical protein
MEATVIKRTKMGGTTPEAVEQKSAFVTAQVLWCGNAWNASAKEAAQQIVADLYEHLSGGGKVSVHVEALDGTEYSLEATARR